jgi:hypothetical protein
LKIAFPRPVSAVLVERVSVNGQIMQVAARSAPQPALAKMAIR